MYTFELFRRHANFSRYGITASIMLNGAHCEDTPLFQAHCSFYGRDGRKLRSDALRWAKERVANLNAK